MLARAIFKVSVLSLSFWLPIQAKALSYAKEDYIQFKLFGKMLSENLWPQSFQHALQVTSRQLEELQASLLAKAEEYFTATLYTAAIPCYEQLLEALTYELCPADENIAEKEVFLLCRLGQAYFYSEQYAKASEHLMRAQQYFGDLSPHVQRLKQESLLFLALSLRQNNNYDLAIRVLKRYSSLDPKPLYTKEVNLELGLNYFLLHKFGQATKFFKRISIQAEGISNYIAAQLYLTRLSLATKNYQAAKLSIKALKQLGLEGSQQQQLAYLQGEMAYQTKHYAKAIRHLEKALKGKEKHSIWYHESLYRLGWSLLKYAKQQGFAPSLNLKLFERAQASFCKAIKSYPTERNYLALAQSHLIKAKLQPQNNTEEEQKRLQSLAAAEDILASHMHFMSTEGKAKALLLQAQAAMTPELKERHLSQLLQDEFCHTNAYLHGLFEKGISHYQLGLQWHESEQALALKAYQSAAVLFERCLQNPCCTYTKLARRALRWYINALCKEGSLAALIKAWHALEVACTLPEGKSASERELAELHYLQGITAVQLAAFKGYETYIQKAEDLFLKNIQQPGQAFTDLNLFALASLYMHQNHNEKAAALFLRVIDEFPMSESRSAALHGYIQVAEKLKFSHEKLAKYRQELFEKYSHSAYAALAYFHYFSYREYMQGVEVALEHLQKMENKFPDSPVLINAHYLLGLDHKRHRKVHVDGTKKSQLLTAISAFRAAEMAFERLYAQKYISIAEMPYYALIRFRAALERAYTNQALGQASKEPRGTIFLQYAKDLFHKINSELNDKNNPLAQLVGAGEGLLPAIQEEALYAELQLDIATGRQNMERSIESILNKYHLAGITTGYYLSRIYYELGQIKMAQKDYENASQAYAQAEECDQDKFLSIDQRLDLWIKQSQCHTNMGLMDKAMLVLSRVINHRAVSSLRVQAMYLRAHIYKLQGRHDLAYKQLKATAKKGGQWAAKARLALETEYR